MEVAILPLGAATKPVVDTYLNVDQAESHWSWFTTLAQTICSPDEDLVIAAVLDERGICRSSIPIIRKGMRWRGASCSYTTKFAPPLQDDNSAAVLARGLAGKCSEFRLDSLSEELLASAFISNLRKVGFAVVTYRHFANWYEDIDDFSGYWTQRSRRLKSLIQRKSRRLQLRRALEFERVDLRAGLDRGTKLYEAIYAKSWKQPEPHPSFIEALLKNLGSIGLAQLAVAYIDGRPAAAQVWLVRPPYATIFKLAHDPIFDEHSPGSLLTHWMLRQVQENDNVTMVDFGRGNDEYKKLWLKFRRYRYGVIAVDPWTFWGVWRYLTLVLPTRLSHQKFVQTVRQYFRKKTEPLTPGRDE